MSIRSKVLTIRDRRHICKFPRLTSTGRLGQNQCPLSYLMSTWNFAFPYFSSAEEFISYDWIYTRDKGMHLYCNWNDFRIEKTLNGFKYWEGSPMSCRISSKKNRGNQRCISKDTCLEGLDCLRCSNLIAGDTRYLFGETPPLNFVTRGLFNSYCFLRDKQIV